MKQVFDEVIYVPLENGNSLTLRKALPQIPVGLTQGSVKCLA